MGLGTSGIYLGPTVGDVAFSSVFRRTGIIESVNTADVTFVVPGFIPPTAVEALQFSDEMSPLHLSIVQKLRSFAVALEATASNLTQLGAHDLYAEMREHHPKRASISAAAALELLNVHRIDVTRNQSILLNLAMHQLLMDDPEHFLADPVSHRTSGEFSLRKVEQVREYELVRGWARQGMKGKEIVGFAQRAAAARAWGRKHPPTESAKDGELSVHPSESVGVTWTKSDHRIINFLTIASFQARLTQAQPYMICAPNIIKWVDQLSGTLDGDATDSMKTVSEERISEFLAEIGVATPWENWSVRAENGGLMEWGEKSSRPRPPSKEAVPSRAGVKSSKAPTTLGPEDLYALDPHDAVRQDFNELPVYTIDDPSASELDDGISLAPAAKLPSGEKTYWIHAHIADPTSLLHPAHSISALAKSRDSSIYFPERMWSMLPSWFVRGKGLSLGSKQNGLREEKVLTMSTRVSNSGEVLAIDVKAGVVRNVKRLTYSAVDEVLGEGPAPRGLILTEPVFSSARDGVLGGDVDAVRDFRRTDDAILATDAKALADLRTLHHLASQLCKRRVAAEALIWNYNSSHVSVTPEINYGSLVQPTPVFYSSSPLVTLALPSLVPRKDTVSVSQMIVSEVMVLANRTAARYAVEKGIPVPFRGQPQPKEMIPGGLARVLSLRDPQTGEVDMIEILRAKLSFQGAGDSVVPSHHSPMGIIDDYGYVKVTSPLRRYSDMLSHWQIKSTLLPSGSPGSKLPFDRHGVMDAIRTSQLLHKTRGRASKNAEAFWALYLIKKKLTNPGLDPIADEVLNNLTCVATRDEAFSLVEAQWTRRVMIPELGLTAQLITPNAGEGPEIGEKAKVRLQDIVLNARSRVTVTLR